LARYLVFLFMHYVLLVIAFALFVFVAPGKAIAAVCALMLVTAYVVKVSTKAVTGAAPSYGEALKAVGLALLLLAIAKLTMASFSIGTGIGDLVGIPDAAMSLGFLASYVAGFSIALGVTFFPSILIALASTAASIAALLAIKNIFY
jgi:hypothetical protein